MFVANQCTIDVLIQNKPLENHYTELAKKVCPRLRNLDTAPGGGITQTFLAITVAIITHLLPGDGHLPRVVPADPLRSPPLVGRRRSRLFRLLRLRDPG